MITDSILLVFQGFINILLAPLTALTLAVDFLASITAVQQFLQVVTYMLPWNNLLPLIIFIVGLFVFRIIMSIIRLVVEFIPFM